LFGCIIFNFCVSRYQEALNAANEAQVNNPGDGSNYFLLGRIHAQLGNKEEAIENVKMSLTIDPRNNARSLLDELQK
jgi:Flp pilus assembly protein TadD